jgi:hypothetical protein
MVAPLRATLGIARSVGPQSWISAEVDYQTAMDTPGREQQPTVNGRVGVRWQPSDTLALGVGLFSDRATARDVGTSIGDSKVDYYGATFGLTFLTPVALVKNPQPDALILSSTLALRYAIGFGDARAIDLDIDSLNVVQRTVSVVYHEIVPYLGTGLFF